MPENSILLKKLVSKMTDTIRKFRATSINYLNYNNLYLFLWWTVFCIVLDASELYCIGHYSLLVELF